METCENCGHVISETEAPAVWQDQVVCEKCRQKLVANSSGQLPPSPKAAPSYGGLGVSGSVLRVIGIAVAVLSCLVVVAGLFTSRHVVMVVSGAGGIVYGIFICACGEVFLALRDIAISTWTLRDRA